MRQMTDTTGLQNNDLKSFINQKDATGSKER